ncbi:MAG: hypothetical protein ACOY3D_01165 [Candidatus Omnitrophota bacterium]
MTFKSFLGFILQFISGILVVLILILAWIALPTIERANFAGHFPEGAAAVCLLDLQEKGVSEAVAFAGNKITSRLVKTILPGFLPKKAGMFLMPSESNEPAFLVWIENGRLARLVWISKLPLNYMLKSKGLFCGAYKDCALVSNNRGALKRVLSAEKAPIASHRAAGLAVIFINRNSSLKNFMRFLEDKTTYAILLSSGYIKRLDVYLDIDGLDVLKGRLEFGFRDEPGAAESLLEDIMFMQQILTRLALGSNLTFSDYVDTEEGRNITFNFKISGLSNIIKEYLH